MTPDALRQLPLLRDLNNAALRELAARAVVRRFAPDETLWLAGAEPRGLFLVLEGEVRVVRAVYERRQVVHVEGAGGTLGEVPLFGGGRYPATAVATRRTVCLVLSRDAVAAAIRCDTGFAFTLLERLAQRTRHVIERLDALGSTTVQHRLGRYLLVRHESAGGSAFTLGCTQSALAEELGTVREVLVRSLRELRTAGVIRPAGRARFEVIDIEKLRLLTTGAAAPR
jgi:CRP/FNR family transcriptional regulator, dissimilatory nitrate respiration regulator